MADVFPARSLKTLIFKNAYYEICKQSVEVTNIFVFNFFGEIIHAGVNYPGSWHDSGTAHASKLYSKKLSDEMTPPGMAILGDSALVNCENSGKVTRMRKMKETSDIPETTVLAALDNIMQRILPRERQSAEWGMGAIKGAFKRLFAPLPADSMK